MGAIFFMIILPIYFQNIFLHIFRQNQQILAKTILSKLEKKKNHKNKKSGSVRPKEQGGLLPEVKNVHLLRWEFEQVTIVSISDCSYQAHDNMGSMSKAKILWPKFLF